MEKGNFHEMYCWRKNTPTMDVEMDNMVSAQLKVTDNEVHKLDKGQLNDILQNKKMMYEGNKNGNDIMFDRQEDHQM